MTLRLFRNNLGSGVLASLLILFSNAVTAQSIEDEAVAWLQDFIRVDTVNPPGNETRAVEFYREIFDAEGIEYDWVESAPGRGNIWARLEGGDEPGLMLLQHTDVVPADKEFWTTDPLSGELRDGYILGRGARDMKGTGIAHLATFLGLHRSGRALNRDVVFLATADEEAGGFYGAGWLIENRPEIDRWIISKLSSLIKDVDAAYHTYEPTRAGRAIQEFVNDHLSNWYVRLCRRRFWKGDYSEDKIAAYQTLYTCLEVVAQLASPIAPFYSDKLYTDLASISGKGNTTSVHLSDFPTVNESVIDTDLEQRMDIALSLIHI